MPFAAIEFRPPETANQVIRQFMETAHTQKQDFATLELLGILTLGRMKFLRFRTDCKAPVPVLQAMDRGVIYQSMGGYVLTFPGQAPRDVSISSMQSVGDLGKRTYRGPSVKFWERQFM